MKFFLDKWLLLSPDLTVVRLEHFWLVPTVPPEVLWLHREP